jgi:hypothetical protein
MGVAILALAEALEVAFTVAEQPEVAQNNLAASALSVLFGALVAPFHQLTQGMYDVSYCT